MSVASKVAGVTAAAILLIACSGTGGPAASTGGGSGRSASGAAPTEGAKPGAGGGQLGGPVPAGGDLCGLLGPGDFAAAGVSGAGGPSENNNPPSAYFCVYRGNSSATGGIELDVFLSDTAADAHDAFPEMFAEYLTTNDPSVTVAGADEAALHLPTFEGSTDPALISVRMGKLTFGIGVGTAFADAAAAGEQLQKLAKLVIERADGLGD